MATSELTGKTVLLTGATDGLGRALAADLAGRGATLLLHGRDDDRGSATLAEVAEVSGSDRLSWYRADLSLLAEVRGLADVVGRDHDRLDVLVSNAGIGSDVPGGGARQESADGIELRFAVNYLAGFALTHLLWPQLAISAFRAGRERVVGGAGADRLRRRDARALLQRHPGLLPEQARPDHDDVRPGGWRER